MNLPSCWSCQYTYSYKQAYVCTFAKTKCPSCGEKQYQSKRSKLNFGLIFLMAFIPLFIVRTFTAISFPAYLGMMLLLFIVVSFLLPFCYRFTDEQKVTFKVRPLLDCKRLFFVGSRCG